MHETRPVPVGVHGGLGVTLSGRKGGAAGVSVQVETQAPLKGAGRQCSPGPGPCAPRGAACLNSRPQLGAKTLGGLEGVEVGRSAAGVPRGGSVGTPTHTPQNDSHDALIMLNTHNWGKKISRNTLPISSGSHQPRSDPEVRPGVKFFCVCVFSHF